MKPRLILAAAIAASLLISSNADARLFGRRASRGGESTCGPGGCPPSGGGSSPGVAPGFTALTPLAGASTVLPQASVTTTQVLADQVPVAQVVAAPAPPTITVTETQASPPVVTTDVALESRMAALAAAFNTLSEQLAVESTRTPPALAPAAAPRPATLPFAAPQAAANLEVAKLTTVVAAIAKKLDVPMEEPSPSGMREAVGKLPKVRLVIAYADHEETAEVDLAARVREEIGAFSPSAK